MSYIVSTVSRMDDSYTREQIDTLVTALKQGYGDENVNAVDYGTHIYVSFKGYGHEGEIRLRVAQEA